MWEGRWVEGRPLPGRTGVGSVRAADHKRGGSFLMCTHTVGP